MESSGVKLKGGGLSGKKEKDAKNYREITLPDSFRPIVSVGVRVNY
jgi:hypothetical protein